MLINNIGIISSIDWQQFQNINQVMVLEQGLIDSDFTLGTGTGVARVNSAFFSASGLSGNSQFDLFNMKRYIFGYELTDNLSGHYIKIFYVKNVSGTTLFLCGTGIAGVTHLFGWGYLGQNIYESGHAIYYDLRNGFEVNTGERYFYLSGVGNYELGILSVNPAG